MHLDILDNLDLLVLLGLLVLLSDKTMRTSEESLKKLGGDRDSAWEGSSSHSIITRNGRREYNFPFARGSSQTVYRLSAGGRCVLS